jgi:large subunit ribosomal protein L18
MQNRHKIHTKIRYTIKGTAERPRLAVYRSLNNITAQLIDDTAGKTLAGTSSLKEKGSLTKKAEVVGAKIAELAKELKIKKAVFDRGGFVYTGSVKIVCETARNKGLEI